MAKNVKYRVLFGSDTNKERKIEIYAEYSGSAIELTAGESPFVTSEANSESIETNLRPSTGTMQICTKVPAASVAAIGKSMLTIEDILPEDNADRCVVLSEKSGDSWLTKWQGFVSCEVYNQVYTANPQNLEIPIISMIEALDSIKFKNEYIDGYITIKTAIRMALSKLTDAAGISLFDCVYFPNVNYQILNKYIDPSILIEMSRHDNENKVDYVENGNSFKTIVENVCKLMGWIMREDGRNLYFIPTNHNTNDSTGMVYETYYDFSDVNNPTFTPASSPMEITTINMSSLTPMGTGHNKSIYQGKTFVEIIANIKKYEQDLQLPDFPRGELIGTTNDQYMYVCNNYEYSRYSGHKYILFWYDMVERQGVPSITVNVEKIDQGHMVTEFLNRTEYYIHSEIYDNYYPVFVTHTKKIVDYNYSVMSFFATWKGFGTWDEMGTTDPNDDIYTPGSDIEGLVLYGIPDRYMYSKGSSATTPVIPPIYISTNRINDSSDIFIYKQETPNVFFSNNGNLRLKINCGYYDYSAWYFYEKYFPSQTTQIYPKLSLRGRKVNLTAAFWDEYPRIEIAVKWGTKWYTGSGWSDTFTRFWAKFDDNGLCEMLLGIDQPITGKITVYFSPYMRGTYCREILNGDTSLMMDAFYPINTMMITSLSVMYESATYDDSLNDSSTNNYFALLDTKFHDGLSVHTDIASQNMNKQSPSIIINSVSGSSISLMSFLTYNLANGTANRRPEKDLLQRLSKWYGKIRRKIELVIQHPNNTIFPMTKIQADAANGYDGKLYLPIAEQRDWKTDVSTITCLEDSDGDPQ